MVKKNPTWSADPQTKNSVFIILLHYHSGVWKMSVTERVWTPQMYQEEALIKKKEMRSVFFSF